MIHGRRSSWVLKHCGVGGVSGSSGVCWGRSARRLYIVHLHLGSCVGQHDVVFSSVWISPPVHQWLTQRTNLCGRTGKHAQAGSDRRRRKPPCSRGGGMRCREERCGNKARSTLPLDHLGRQEKTAYSCSHDAWPSETGFFISWTSSPVSVFHT